MAVIWRLWRAVRVATVSAAAITLTVVATATFSLMAQLPDAEALMDGRETGSVTVLDQDGLLLGVRGQRFEPISTAEASPSLLEAILSIEDRRFYLHPGLDPIGTLRALYVNYRIGSNVQGGSSISQQVAKLAFLNPKKTYERKLRELPLALALDLRFSKDQILSMYLNRAYLGASAFGFEAAAQRYFQKSAKAVDVAESALLAGLLRAPSRWSPERDFAGAQARGRLVLDAMVDNWAISQAEADAARNKLDRMAPLEKPEIAPFFLDWVVTQIPEELVAPDADYVVRTTFERPAQSASEKAIATVFSGSLANMPDAEASVVVMSPDGAVRAMVGGRDYSSSQFNRAAQAKRQFGSAFKPFLFTAALEAGMGPSAWVNDSRYRIGRWSPRNYGGTYRGWVTLETALAKSSNSVAARLIAQVGVKRTIALARRFGFQGEIPPYPAISLGTFGVSPVEAAAAYAVFANGGYKVTPYTILEIQDPVGSTLWTRPRPNVERAIRPSHAGWMTTMLGAVVTDGTGRRAQLPDGRPVAGKTGTTQNSRDAWFAGFTGDRVAVAWIGKDVSGDLNGMTGGREPAEIWRLTMEELHGGQTYTGLPAKAIPASNNRPIATRAQPQPRYDLKRKNRQTGWFGSRDRSNNRQRNDPLTRSSDR
ncbi:MAG: PBP1A family penicillin-binding protein [Pseudomonadota bacterium]